ncbi:putative phytosulfokines 6 isoform X2 [Gastrolobium bilobum]|uniref:putative phytosulfokines 6 isoform X2 n=1 Tax=Gastrolobium bilobum TaxID=150636 RepID=UPI002AB0B376|nr:putative phytosulfokines 6 isoform X2 [Gastrolobium bilobum]
MKLSFQSGALLFFLFFLVSSSKLFARPLINEQGQNRKLGEVSGEDFVLELEGSKSLKLMGVEDCNSGDEECFKRRMTLEAHLDYIYTQHHKP